MRLWIKVLLLGVLSVSFANAERSLKVQDMQNEARVALVIGNGKYDEQPLKNPTNDSKAMKEILLKKGFEVIYKENATQEEMESSIDKFLNTLKSKKAVGLLYYAGHGIEAKGENYLIPIGAKISSENFIKQKTIALNSIIEGMQDSKNELNIVILDACRDNPYRGIVRSGKRGLTGINNANGIFIAYATAVGDVAADGSGKNGLFTSSLLKYIDEEGLKLEDVFKAVHHDVKKQSSGIQQPWMNSAIYGDFYFTLPKVQNTQVATQSVSQVVKPVVVQEVIKPVIPKEVVVIDGLWYQNQPFTKEYKWEDAKDYCDNLTLGGKSDWRLPTIDELRSVVNGCGGTSSKSFDNTHNIILIKNKNNSFYQSCYKNKGFINSGYWGFTSFLERTYGAWIVDFDNGVEFENAEDNRAYIKCVRAKR